LLAANPKELGYPHECGRRRLLTRHLAQGTLCKILTAYEIKPHKSAPYYLERPILCFDEKMAEVLRLYREFALLKQSAVAPRAGNPQRLRSSLTMKSPAYRRSERRRRTCRQRLCATIAWPRSPNMFDMER